MTYTARYSELEQGGARPALRHAAISLLARLNRNSARQRMALERKRVQFLYLHHLFEDEQAPFYELLRRLSRHFKFISYSEAVERIVSGKIDEPSLTFTFDDGVSNCLGAAKILSEFGASAAFFLCPSIIGQTDAAKVEHFCRERLHMPPMPFMSWADVEGLLAAGHEIGGHSQTHANLGEISAAALDDEIAGSYEALKSHVGEVKHFAWPFGKFEHFSRGARDAVFRAGYRSCASAIRGSHVSQALGGVKSLCIRRDHVVAAWPIEHILYFLAKSSAGASVASNLWPAEYMS